MNYRLYVDEGRGYELKGTYKLKKVLDILDDLAMYGDMPRLMVVEHDEQLNMDSVFFTTPLYLEEYFNWREKIEEKQSFKKRR